MDAKYLNTMVLRKVDKTYMYGALIGNSPFSMFPPNELLKSAKRAEHLRGRFLLYFDNEKHGKLTDKQLWTFF